MIVYVITADTYQDNYGAEISMFGVFEDETKANEAVKELNKKYNYYFEIKPTELNKINEVHLGGFYE